MKTPDLLALLKQDIDVFACDWDVIHAGMYAMYAASASVEEDCYSCVPRVARVEAASLGAFDSASTGAELEEALHTFTLDSGASRCFFRDSTTVIPLVVHVPVTLADPSGGPPGGKLVAICTDSRTGEHLATFTRRPGFGLYTLTSESALVDESGQIAALAEVAASCSCRLLTHQTLLWHHRLGHPSLPCLRGMHSRLLVSGLPRSLPPLPRSLALPCLPCIEGRQRTAPHSSSFPPTAPLQTLHMDVWGPAHVTGQGGERYFLLVVKDDTRYTTVFTLQSKANVRVPLPPLSLVDDPPPPLVAPLPPPSPAPSGVSRVYPPPLVEPLEVSSDTSGPAEGGNQTATDTMAPRRSVHLAVPPGFPPRPTSPPLRPVAVDSGAAGGGDNGSADSRGAGSGGAASPTSAGGAGAGGAASPTSAGGAGGDATGGSAGGGAGDAGAGGASAHRQETLSPERLREWAVRWGSPGEGGRCAGAAGFG
ncbi:unnamed protein product, partial [Closterium sp. NIES-54]